VSGAVVVTQLPNRRQRARAALIAAHARRARDPRSMSSFLAGYLVGLAETGMSDHDVAETVRGLAAGWRQIEARTGTEDAPAELTAAGAL
jgi:hypothetical protein